MTFSERLSRTLKNAQEINNVVSDLLEENGYKASRSSGPVFPIHKDGNHFKISGFDRLVTGVPSS